MVPALSRDHAAQRLPPEQKPAEADDPPTILEIVRLHLEDAARRVVAGVVDGQIHVGAGMVEQRGHVSLVGGVRDDRGSFASRSLDVRDDRVQRGLRAPGRDNVEVPPWQSVCKVERRVPDPDRRR